MTLAIDDLMFAPLVRRHPGVSRRSSSWDRTGGNLDFVRVEPGSTVTLLDERGPGCVTHLYCAMVGPDITDHRDAILRCHWDGEASPSVEVPLGDFFGLCHGRVRRFQSAMVSVNPGMGASFGLNAYFPMPFGSEALVTIENRSDRVLGGPLGCLWYHVEYLTFDEPLTSDTLRFHASYRQERPTTPACEPANIQLHAGRNTDGRDNYVALEAVGRGHMVGLVLEIDNLAGGWYGEGDDMVFIDEDVWPPSIHGTGTEEVFGGGACPTEEYCGPYSGFHLIENPDFSGLVGMYRWYVPDPIVFDQSIRWTIEHGHANNFANDYSSVAYWYQAGRRAPLQALPDREALRPPLPPNYEEVRDATFAYMAAHTDDLSAIAAVSVPFYRGDFEQALARAGA
ncbi:MAG: hypothetical protein JJLCMIEE_03625 [Acidimicrobiales bacterium]|nr:hypothetical protein [Acidimicrobiales bacterium]